MLGTVNGTALTFELRMGFYCYGYEQIAWGSTVCAGITLTTKGEGLAVCDSGWDSNVYFFLLSYRTGAVAFRAWLMYDFTLAMAAWTFLCGLHYTERCSLLDSYCAGAVAIRAYFRSSAWGTSTAAAGGACVHACYVYLFLTAESGLLKSDSDASLYA